MRLRIEWTHVDKWVGTDDEQKGGDPSRRRRRGLLDFTVTLREGITVVLGPEASGKSTLLRVTSTVSVPDDGRITYVLDDQSYVWSRRMAAKGGAPPVASLRRKIGYVPPYRRLQMDLGLEESLVDLALYHGVSHPKRRAVETVARWGLAAYRRHPLRELPEHVASRYLMASSLVGDPVLWVVDEPSADLEDWGYRLFLAELKRRRGKGITLIATDDLELAEEADYLLLMESGSCRRIGQRKLLTSSVPDGTVASWYQAMQTFTARKTTHKR
ncbi:ATP-binding cassette domain-containing protein [Kroppenstedtia eburnea]|uniref:ABC transporter n=1 Tax=Kroppenstedtia eburnea TaxID=714067 RepID=A0A1N7PYK7_9BACL|nr:ATP-binding cassette domain-containing protein [Kroppenstedtia eburnea]QKI81053.1 ATP-binding cassette domain-containing protein [Kroppenstedtia eburnea]SIT15733.1 ABC transporter [Kroppenstedtia eburnea]